jgi:hypothetical protein
MVNVGVLEIQDEAVPVAESAKPGA